MRFMQKIKKRAGWRAAGILTACCLTFSPVTALPAAAPLTAEAITVSGGNCGPNAQWNLSGTTMTISGSGAVTSESAYSAAANVATAVVVENGITSLPQNAFSSFEKITSLKMADSVTTLGAYLCNNCSSLKTLQLSANLTEIPSSAFSKCLHLSEVKLPSGLKTIAKNAFYGAIDLKELTIPDSVTTIEKYAFYGNNIQTITLGKSVKVIGDQAFNYSCFKTITIPATIESIGTNAIGPYWTVVSAENGNIVGKCYGTPGITTIKGTPGTAAESYAKANSLNFEPVGGGSHTHSWSDWKIKTAAGCETDGVSIRTCSGCGATEEQTIPATGHSMGEWKITLQPTCTETGKNERSCSKCGKTESQFIAATGHDWSDWVTEKEPTVTDSGLRVRTCHNCGNRLEETIEKLASYRILASSSDGGTITPNGAILVEAGTDQTFKIQPDAGYRIRSIIVDNIEQTTADSYTFYTVTSNHYIDAVFEKIPTVPKRECIQIQIKPNRSAWFSDLTAFARNDFTITAVFSENGAVHEEDITNSCSTDNSPKQLTADGSYDFKTVNFRYNGNDSAVQNYVNSNAFSTMIPIYLRGDFNRNGSVQASDATQALQIYLDRILELYEISANDIELTLIDVDEDGDITAKDAMFILTYYIENALLYTNTEWSTILNP